jgi:V8-like Glu-specific endopeptidase
MPYKLTGKVFFVQEGKNYVCSASAAGNNAILTAGHCVSNGKGVYHTVSVFQKKLI